MNGRRRRWMWLSVAALFCACVLLKLNGSSVGIWTELLNEPKPAHGLLLFTPKGVRADEWHGWTPAALSQSRQTPRYPIQNLTLGGGRTPLVMNVPVAYYTTFFRPQLWGFFLFDFERGYSFYWCLKIFGLLLASAWLLRQIGVRDGALVALGALWIFFSGYVQWWFSSPAMLPEMLATCAICIGCAIRFLKETNFWRTALAFSVFVFCGVNFALCLYPPYQIPLAFLGVAIGTGIYLETRREKQHWNLRGMILIIGAVVAVIVALVPFLIDAGPTLRLVAHTDYPGARRVTGGGLSLFQLFSGLTGFFQTEDTFPAVYANIAEASSFYPLWIPAMFMVLVALWRKSSRVSPLMIALAVVILGLSVYCTVPWPHGLLRLTLLEFVTEQRALLALGIAGILFCCVFLERYRTTILTRTGAIVVAVSAFVAIAVLIWLACLHTPGLFPNQKQLVAALAVDAVVIGLFFWESTRRWALPVLILALIVGNIGVNPVMRGLAPLLESEAFKAVDQIRAADQNGKWIVYNDPNLAQLVVATGAPVLNGNKIVPDFTLWQRLDPTGGSAQVYNRYANVICQLAEPGERATVRRIQRDSYVLSLPPDLSILPDTGCRYFLFPTPWPDAERRGFVLIDQIERSHIWIYRRRPSD